MSSEGPEKQKSESPTSAKTWGLAMPLGIAMGAGVGAALGNVGVGVAIGVALGVGLGNSWNVIQGKK